MRRTALLGVCAAWLVGVSGTAFAGERGSIAKSLGELRWGMGQSEVVATLIEKIESSYADEIAKTRMTPKETDVRRRMKAEVADLRAGHVTFNGSPTRWDNTFLEGEFTHGNGESLVTYADASSRNFYFFIDGKLWKWVKAFDQPTFSGKDFDDFSRFVRDRFGGGNVKRGARTPQGNAARFVEVTDSKTRLRAFDRIGGDRSFALVFEDKGTIGRLASLRKNHGRSGSSRGDDREVASHDENEGSGSAPVGRFGDRRSVSAHEEQHQESESEWRQRRERESREARAHQQEQHARRQQEQRGRTLDGLAGMNDSDPLSGFGQ